MTAVPAAPTSSSADDATLDRLARTIGDALGPHVAFRRPEDVLMYEYDYGFERGTPDIAVLPRSTAEVQTAVRLAHEAGVPIVARGAGTGINGGAVPRRGGMIVSLARMNRVLEIDVENRLAVVQPGVVNLELSQITEPHGLFFAPDPASQKASTIGGNIGNNAGGPHCLALGVTTNHILGLEVVLHDGTVVRLGGKSWDRLGYDLVGLLVGSEGTLGLVTEATVRLLPLPESIRTTLAIFPSIEAAGEAVSRIIGHGIVPAALEMMDRLAIQAVEEAFHAGYPPEAGAILLVEVDGLHEQVDPHGEAVDRICREVGALSIGAATTSDERARLWAGRKGAASAMGRVAPNYYLHDAVVPRTRLPEILAHVVEVGRKYDLPIANLFHAGDGNLHPMILFDARDPGILDRVHEAGDEILRACVAAGGTITGEHGVGLEKQEYMPLIFAADDLDVMSGLRKALDPDACLNPDKIFPLGSSCHDVARAAPRAGMRPPTPVPDGTEGMWV